jgi:hypothetical protein
MQTQKMKNFFLFSLSVSMLFACCACGFYLWEHEHEKCLLEKKREQEEVLLKQLQQEEFVRQVEKRARLDKHYANELWNAAVFCLNPQNKLLQNIQSGNNMTRVENNMIQDRYDRAEIGTMQRKAFSDARQYWNSSPTQQK